MTLSPSSVFQIVSTRLWSGALLVSALSGCASAATDSAREGTDQAGSSTSSATTTGTTGAYTGDGDGDYPIYSTGNVGGQSQGQGGEPGQEDSIACVRLLSIGKPAAGGAVPGEKGLDAVVDWLNKKSNVAAKHVAYPVSLTEELLGETDVLLLQDLAGWDISTSDVGVVSSWVRRGGAVVALSGYEGAGEGVVLTNQLLSFSGLSFNITGSDTALALGECGYCLGSSRKTTGFEPEHAIGNDVVAVGAFLGRSVQGAGELVIAEEGKQLGVAQKVERGRVFLYHDDWITFVPMWTGQVSFYCDTNPGCSEQSPQVSYQTAQLWYNILNWTNPDSSCLSIDDESIVD